MAKKDNGKNPNRRTPGLSKEVADNVKRGVLSGGGYGRPPEHTRFRKGQSGNPKGRPKHRDAGAMGSHARDLFLKQAERMITIREGEETRQIPAIEGVHYAEFKSALGGNAYAQKHITECHFRADRERQAENAAFIERAKAYVAICRKEIAEAERRGEPPPLQLPHPDDVIIEGNRVRLVGPINKAELAKLEETIKVRDALIMQDALDHCLADDPEGDDQPGSALLFAMLLDKSVPARFRLAEADWTERMMRCDRMSKRALLKAVYRAWKALGRRVPRGRTLPPLRWGNRKVEELAAMLEGISHHRASSVNSAEIERFHSVALIPLGRVRPGMPATRSYVFVRLAISVGRSLAIRLLRHLDYQRTNVFIARRASSPPIRARRQVTRTARPTKCAQVQRVLPRRRPV